MNTSETPSYVLGPDPNVVTAMVWIARMPPFRQLIIIAVTGTFLFSVVGNQARANVFSDLAGVVTDPLKLDSSSQRVQTTAENIMAQIPGILSMANSLGQQRLDQLQSILNSGIAGGQSLESKTFSDLTALEQQVNADAEGLIFKARCAAVQTLQQTFQQAVVDAVSNLAKAKPTVRIFGIPVGQLTANQVQITSPDSSYIQTRDLVLSNLNSDIGDGSNAYQIVSVYRNLQALAQNTECFYLDSTVAQDDFIHEVSRFEVLQQAWAIVAPPILLPDSPNGHNSDNSSKPKQTHWWWPF